MLLNFTEAEYYWCVKFELTRNILFYCYIEHSNLKATEVLSYGLSPENGPQAFAQERSVGHCVCAGPQPAGRKQIKEARLSVSRMISYLGVKGVIVSITRLLD